MSSKPPHRSAFEVLSDDEGSVTLGWVAEDVFYTRFTGGLSATIGMAHAARLRDLLAGVSSLSYFADSSALSHYELLARSAFARLILENRRKFSELVMLTWSVGVSHAGSAFATAVGDPITLLTDARDFEQRLVAAAPLAKQRLDPRMWEKPSASAISASSMAVFK
ncbi:MAG TPA: hypothetical protein VHW01_18115 [Polyangiaceae bacterium]|jgi:hypothetical protein|nr:hypothetical protein [Polyangiaceae bacterium]